MTYRKVWRAENADYRAEAADRLRELFPQGSEVTTMVRHVTPSGMGRTVVVLAIDRSRETSVIRNVSHDVARVLDWREDSERGGVYVEGCGMDMCFHLTYTLARKLYADRGGVYDENLRDAGYLLNQRTI